MNTIIECTNTGRTFTSRSMMGKKQETVALHNLSFTVQRGTVFGLLGPNGAGKTTSVKILSTLLTPTTGQARVMGYDVVRDAAKIRKRIGLILGGDRGLYGRLTGIENLKYFAALNHIDRKTTRKRINDLIGLVGLDSNGDRLVEQYSRGMKQRLHVARGLLTDPDLLFMDEPTIGLDPVGAQELRQLIPELVRQDKTIVLTTHYMLEADELCDHLAIIDKGGLVASGTPSDIKKKFSKTAVLEVILKKGIANEITELNKIQSIEHINASSNGPSQKLAIHVRSGIDIEKNVTKILGLNNIESMVMRESTLEEAYLSILS